MDVQCAIVDINYTAREQTPAQFRERALNILQHLVRFDTASWSSLAAPGRVPRDVQLWRQKSSMIKAYLEVRSYDVVSAQTGERAGEPQLFNWLSSRDQRQSVPEFRAFCKDRGYLNVLSVMVKSSPFNYTNLSLSREDAGRPFDEDDAMTVKSIVPHLMNAWVMNHALNPISLTNDLEPSDATAMVCSSSGKLLGEATRFKNILTEEFPEWNEQHLPGHILATINRCNSWESRDVKILSRPVADVQLLIIRRTSATMLTSRELEVCRSAAFGLTYKEIAYELNISSGTVKNHLYNSYSKLGVRNKASLSRILNLA